MPQSKLVEEVLPRKCNTSETDPPPGHPSITEDMRQIRPEEEKTPELKGTNRIADD